MHVMLIGKFLFLTKKLLLNLSITDCYLYQLLSFRCHSHKTVSVQISRSAFEQNVSEITL
jgi:hypothetical protein